MIALEDRVIIRQLGKSLLNFFSVATAVTAFYSIYVCVTLLSSRLLLRRGLKVRYAWAILLINVLNFILVTIYWVGYLHFLANFIRTAFLDTSLSWEAKAPLATKDQTRPSLLLVWATQPLAILGDVVVIWRAWVLFREPRWIMAIPFTLWLGTAAMAFTFLGLSSDYNGDPANLSQFHMIINLQKAILCLSLSTNAVSTILIGFRLWVYRMWIKEHFGPRRRSSDVDKILILLVESGMLFCAVQLTTLTLALLFSTVDYHDVKAIVMLSFHIGTQLVAAIYPPIVVLLVNSQRSFIETLTITASTYSTSRT